MEQLTCEQRIKSELESTIQTLRDLWELYQKDCEAYHDEHETNMYEYGLCFDFVEPHTFSDQSEGYYRYQLSYGGPSDEFRFYIRYDGQPYRIEYWFLDWYDGAHRILQGTDNDLINEIYNWFLDIGSCEAHKKYV